MKTKKKWQIEKYQTAGEVKKPKDALDLGAMGDSINLSGDGGIYDLMQLADGIGKIGNNKGFQAAIGKTTGFKKAANTFFSIFNPAARLITNAANTATNYGNKRDELQQYLEAMQNRDYENFNEDGLNKAPIYFKVGGYSINLPGMKKGGKNKKKNQQYYQLGGEGKEEGYQRTGEGLEEGYQTKIKKSNSIENFLIGSFIGGQKTPPVEGESGEIYMTTDSRLKKIPDSGDRHEDGGEIVNDADRVLENTSTYRKDLDSKTLKLSPEQATSLTGVKFKTPVSHSQAMEDADKHYNKFRFKLNKALEKNVKTLQGDKLEKYATNSLHLNMAHLNSIPTSGEVFDNLFEHQELIKELAGIDQAKAMFGGKYGMPKAQLGIKAYKGDRTYKGNASKYSDAEWNQFAKELGFPGGDNKAFQEFLFNQNGDVGTLGNIQDDVLALHKQYGDPNGGTMFDSRLGHRWDVIMDKYRRKPIERNYPETYTTAQDYMPVDAPANNTGTAGEVKQNFNFKNQTSSKFNEPLNWYDIAGPAGAYLSATDRIPNKLNPAQFNQIRLQLQNPEPSLQAGTADFNAARRTVQNNGTANSNISNLFTSKYNIDNQILGNYENINKGIKNQETMYNANVKDRQSIADQQAREVFEQKFLGSLEAQRQQKLQSLDELYSRFSENKALNRNANLVMQLAPYFDQYAKYNGNQRYAVNPNAMPAYLKSLLTQETKQKKQ